MTGSPASPSTTLLLTRNGLGHADPALQQQLAVSYFRLLLEDERLPAAICCYGEGVRLVCSGSPVLDALAALQARGVPIIACKTCLDFYDLADAIEVGTIGSMGDIIEAQWRADKVITL